MGGTTTDLATFTVPVTTDSQKLRVAVNGSTISAKVWPAADPEPGTWSATATDTAITAAGIPVVTAATGDRYRQRRGDASEWVHNDPDANPVTLVDYDWDGDSNLEGETLADGGTRDWTWTDGQLTGLNQNIPGAVRTTTLGYDSTGRIATDVTNGVTTTYTYDNADQLGPRPHQVGPHQHGITTPADGALADRWHDSVTFAYERTPRLRPDTRTPGR